jgi:hypothetical protein
MQNSPATSVEALVRSASRRRHGLLALEQFKSALTIVLAGAILLLLLGTQILDWYWLVLLALVGVTVGAFRFRSGRLSLYRIAQILDRRLNLSDTVSSAWFVLKTPAPSNATRQLQLRHAETVAAAVQPRVAFPPQQLRTWAPNGLLFLILFTLFAVRYFSHDQLSFRQTLLPIHFGHPSKTEDAKLQTNSHEKQESALRKTLDLPPAAATSPLHESSNSETGSTIPGQKNELERKAISSREAGQPNGQSNPNASQNTQGQQSPSADMSASNNLPNQPLSSSQTASQQSPSTTNPSGRHDQQQPSKDTSTEEQSLTSKLRDVLSGLLAKMQEGSSQQRGDAGGNRSHSGKQDRNATGTNQSDQSARNNDSKEAQASSLQSQQPPQNAQTASNSPSKGSGNAAGHRSSDSRSAAGRQDGSKDSKEAEELRAMGTLQEIIGKRSASLTGEMTVDSPSGTQQLRTGYTNRSGTHSGIGSQIDHDDIPLEDQQYVREYMKQVHNQPESR